MGEGTRYQVMSTSNDLSSVIHTYSYCMCITHIRRTWRPYSMKVVSGNRSNGTVQLLLVEYRYNLYCTVR